MGHIDCLMHLGDGVKDVEFLEAASDIPVYAVAGNCDFAGGYPAQLTVELGGRKIFLTHGHTFNVRNSARLLINNAIKHGYDITLFGHTHVSEVFAEGKHVFMNPGSTCYPRGPHGFATCGVIELRDGEIFPSLMVL